MKQKLAQSTRVNAAQAQKYLDMNTYEAQRPMRSKRIEQLCAAARKGLFLAGHFAVVHKNGESILMNGQHQAAMIIRTKVIVKASLDEFWLNDDEGDAVIATLFSQYDEGGMRTGRDVVGYHRHCFRLMDINLTACNRIAGALGYLEWGHGYGSRPKQERAALLGPHRKDALWVNQFSSSSSQHTRHIERVPVIAAFILFHRKDDSDADVFCQAVRDGDMLKRTEPAYALREYLVQISTGEKYGKKSLSMFALNREIFVKCIHAWNAYRKGKTTQLKYHAEADMPKVM